MPATTSAPVSSITEIARLDGVPPNMSVSTTTPLSPLTRGHGRDQFDAPLVHVVVGADGDGLHVFLTADHVLQRRPEFLGEAAMSDNDEADHAFCVVKSGRAGRGGSY